MISNETEIKSFLNITGSSYDTVVSNAAAYADERIKALLGQDVEATETTLTFFGSLANLESFGKRYYVRLKNTPVNSITSITYKTFGEDAETLATSKYELVADGSSYVVVFKDALNGAYVYSITYNYGFDTVPKLVEMLANYYAIEYILKSWTNVDFRRFGLESKVENVEGESYTSRYVSDAKKLEKEVKYKFGLWI